MPLNSFTQATAEKISDECSNITLVKAAKFNMKPPNGLDILVCGRCLRVFHVLSEMQKHKQKRQCEQPESDPSKMNPSPNVWAFMLWKFSSEGKSMKNAGDNAFMYKKWLEIPPGERKGWTVAGNLLFDMNSIHKSNDVEISNTSFPEGFLNQVSEMIANENDENSSQEETKRTKRTYTKRAVEPNDLIESNRIPRNIISKKIDKKTESLKYLVQFEGQCDSKTSWVTESSLLDYKELIDEFEERLTSNRRPCRSSKAKAMNRVRSWALKKYGEETEDDDVNEEEQKSDVEDEEELGDVSDDEFRPYDQASTDGEKSTTSTEEPEGSDSLEAKPVLKRGRKRKISSVGPKRQKRSVQLFKFKDILHVSNCHRTIQVDADSIPMVKPGIHQINNNPELLLLAPKLCRDKPKEMPTGLVVITNNILRNRPGIRKRQGLKLFEDSVPKIFSQELPDASTKAKPKPKQSTSIIKIRSSDVDPPSPAKKVFVPAKVNNKPTQNKIYSTQLPPADPRTTSNAPSYAKLTSSATTPATSKLVFKSSINAVAKTLQIGKPLVTYTNKTKAVSAPGSAMKRIFSTQPANSTQPTISIQTSGNSQSATGPQHVEIPQGVDPGALEVPAGMQLMVSDNGEYYLLPQQPEGSTVALAHDPESGAVQVVAIPEQPASSPTTENITVSQTPEVITQESVDTSTNATDNGRFVLVMTKEGELMLIQTDQIVSTVDS